MCPFCIATAAVLAGKVTGAGGLAAIAIKKLGGKSAADQHPDSTPKLSRTKNGAGENAEYESKEHQDVNECD